MSEFELVIDEAEWRTVSQKVVPFCDGDESTVRGVVAVTADGSRRHWWAAGRSSVVRVDVGADHRVYERLFSPRLFEAWPAVAGDSGEATLQVSREPDMWADSLVGPGGTVDVKGHYFGEIGPAQFFKAMSSEDLDADASATVDAESLVRLTRLALTPPRGEIEDDTTDWPDLVLAIDPKGLCLRREWDQVGTSQFRMAGPSAGEALRAIDPMVFSTIQRALEGGAVTISLPTDDDQPVTIRQDDYTALLLAPDRIHWVRERVEQELVSVFGDDVVHTDVDGDYVLSIYGVPVYGRLVRDEPYRLQINAAVLRQIPASEALLVELNELNSGIAFVKVLWIDGTVFVVGDLVAHTIDAPEIITLFERVRDVADGMGPSLAALFGGESVQTGETERWGHYTQTAVTAEVQPGEWVDLTGRSAVEQWPFPDAVHVITAWNPFGRTRTGDRNGEDSAQLAADLVRAGASSIRAVGSSYDGTYSESSSLVWNISTDDLLVLARKYRQEAIFRLDDDTVEVLGVFEQQLASRPRLEARERVDQLELPIADGTAGTVQGTIEGQLELAEAAGVGDSDTESGDDLDGDR